MVTYSLVKHAKEVRQFLLRFPFTVILHAPNHHNQELIEVHCATAWGLEGMAIREGWSERLAPPLTLGLGILTATTYQFPEARWLF